MVSSRKSRNHRRQSRIRSRPSKRRRVTDDSGDYVEDGIDDASSYTQSESSSSSEIRQPQRIHNLRPRPHRSRQSHQSCTVITRSVMKTMNATTSTKLTEMQKVVVDNVEESGGDGAEETNAEINGVAVVSEGISERRIRKPAVIESTDSENAGNKTDEDYEEEEDDEVESLCEEDTRNEDTREPYALRARPAKNRVPYTIDMETSENDRLLRKSRRRIDRLSFLYDSEASEDDEQSERGQQMILNGPYIRVRSTQVVDNDAELRASLMFKKSKKAKSGAVPFIMPNVRFDCVGGHSEKIKTLKEMILLPLMYPDFFQAREIKPPRGVLFHGVPGTGKTLLAQALSSECSSGPIRVSFISHKATDFLSKWFGESEKGLRDLFEKARAMAPCIIYLDEIDGLVPCRSGAEESNKIHNTIVTTLLGLMDGLGVVAGGIVVIGSTNRVDAIDPALRRPGRFDREFFFGLPNADARLEIMSIHTRKWTPAPDRTILEEISLHTKGFSGADLQALCREAIVSRMRMQFPSLYRSKKRIFIEDEQVQVTRQDFIDALDKIRPAGMRSCTGFSVCPLPREIAPLLANHRDAISQHLTEQYETMFKKDGLTVMSGHDFGIYCPRMVVFEPRDCGYNTFVIPGVLHHLELPTHCIDVRHLHDPSYSSVEQAVAMIVEKAEREAPSAILLPRVNIWWNTLERATRLAIESILTAIPRTRRVLLIATAVCEKDECPDFIDRLFPYDIHKYAARKPTPDEIFQYFRFLITDQALVQRHAPWANDDETKSLEFPEGVVELSNNQEERLWDQEESTLRAFRIAARLIMKQFCRDRYFGGFKEAVTPKSVNDYYSVIKSPMDFSVILSKIDRHQYFRFKELFDDLRLIHQNAVNYNPDSAVVHRERRHRASYLLDVINSVQSDQICETSESELTGIFEQRKRRGALIQVDCLCSVFTERRSRSPKRNSSESFVRYDPIIAPGIQLRQNNGMEGAFIHDNPNYKRIMQFTPDEPTAKIWVEVIPPKQNVIATQGAEEETMDAANGCISNESSSGHAELKINMLRRAEKLSKRASKHAIKTCESFEELQNFSAKLYALVMKHVYEQDRNAVLDTLEHEINGFVERKSD